MTLRTRPRRSIRLRLTLIYGALFLASGIALLAVTYVLVEHATDDVLVAKGADGSVGAVIGKPPSSGSSSPGERQQFVASTDSVAGTPVHGVAPTPAQLEAQVRQLRAQARNQHANELYQLLLQSAIALCVMAFFSIGLGWIIAGRVLRPLRTITNAARERTASNLHERLALDGPNDELKDLGDTFDALFERLDASFRSQRQFVANASHELRTPLARQRTLSQVALADPHADIESLRTAHERVLASGAQQERLIDALLTLTRVRAGLDRRRVFDLATVTDQAVLAVECEADRLGITLHLALAPTVTEGDPRLVERLVVNLVDNAVRHNVEPGDHGYVEVLTGVRDGRAVVWVVNSGPFVAQADVDRLLLPFQRLHPNRTGDDDGLGLGLSIVHAIAEAHGAELVVRSRSCGGLEVEVLFRTANVADETGVTSSSGPRVIAELQPVI
jgi:signal transduction histidine kinase